MSDRPLGAVHLLTTLPESTSVLNVPAIERLKQMTGVTAKKRRPISRRIRWISAAVALSLGAGVGVETASAVGWFKYFGLAALPTAFQRSSTSLNQNIYNSAVQACSGGVWYKYTAIEVSGSSYIFPSSSTGCTGNGPISYAVGLSRAVCRKQTDIAGIEYAECWRVS